MHSHEKLIQEFYAAFNARDYVTMQQSYHADTRFYDPVFQELNADQVKAMWQMLLSSSKDLIVKASEIKADDSKGSCRWDAWYTFSRTGRKVHNIIHATFQFRNGKIINHHDDFSLWRWSSQALGMPGKLLGWSPLVTNKVRRTAQNALRKYMTGSY
jgi:ketosteroid isomerase-like protein